MQACDIRPIFAMGATPKIRARPLLPLGTSSMWRVKFYPCFAAEVMVVSSGSQHVVYECIVVLKLVKARSYKSPLSAGMNENIAEHGVNPGSA